MKHCIIVVFDMRFCISQYGAVLYFIHLLASYVENTLSVRTRVIHSSSKIINYLLGDMEHLEA